GEPRADAPHRLRRGAAPAPRVSARVPADADLQRGRRGGVEQVPPRRRDLPRAPGGQGQAGQGVLPAARGRHHPATPDRRPGRRGLRPRDLPARQGARSGRRPGQARRDDRRRLPEGQGDRRQGAQCHPADARRPRPVPERRGTARRTRGRPRARPHGGGCIMPIKTGIQRRNYRIGQIKAGDKNEKGLPRRLSGFRFTTHAQNVAYEVAEFFGGDEPRPWGRQWEVYTKAADIAVALPPGNLVISQSMMRWSGGGPVMVCDGETTSQPQRGPCQCPQPDAPTDETSVWEAIRERRRLAAMKTPQGCYPYTWFNVCLPDIAGGAAVWQLLSKSENAAAEIIAQAALLEQARAAGQYLPARLALEYREARVDGMLRQYNVPVLRVDASIRAIANGDFAGRSLADQLPPAPG